MCKVLWDYVRLKKKVLWDYHIVFIGVWGNFIVSLFCALSDRNQGYHIVK